MDVDKNTHGELGLSAAGSGEADAAVPGVSVPEGDVAMKLGGGGDAPLVSMSGLEIDAAAGGVGVAGLVGEEEESTTPSKKSRIGDKLKKFKGMLKKKSVRY